MPTYAKAKCLSPLHPYTSRELQKTYMLLSILIHCYAFITLRTNMHIPPIRRYALLYNIQLILLYA